MWKGDTSSDEVFCFLSIFNNNIKSIYLPQITGHFFVYPIFHDLVCETDEERQRPVQLMHNIASYIVENNFYLIDITGIFLYSSLLFLPPPTLISGLTFFSLRKCYFMGQVESDIHQRHVYLGRPERRKFLANISLVRYLIIPVNSTRWIFISCIVSDYICIHGRPQNHRSLWITHYSVWIQYKHH